MCFTLHINRNRSIALLFAYLDLLPEFPECCCNTFCSSSFSSISTTVTLDRPEEERLLGALARGKALPLTLDDDDDDDGDDDDPPLYAT